MGTFLNQSSFAQLVIELLVATLELPLSLLDRLELVLDLLHRHAIDHLVTFPPLSLAL